MSTLLRRARRVAAVAFLAVSLSSCNPHFSVTVNTTVAVQAASN